MKHALLIPFSTAALFLAGCGGNPTPNEPPASLPAASVRLTRVAAETLADTTEVTGVVRPARRAQVAAKVMGVIEDMPVRLGQAVRQGDLLVQIGAGEISARLAQAKSQLNAARRDLERERELLGKGASTADMVKGLEDRFSAAEAMVREAETMLGYTSVRAPFDGVVARTFADTGDLASPGMPLLQIDGSDGFEVDAGIPDSLAGGLSLGATLQVSIPATGLTFSGKLAEISSAADPGAHTVPVRIAIPAETPARSGQFVRVHVPGKAVAALLVPASAVTPHGQMQRVFVAGESDRAVLRLVKVGARHGERVEILGGLDDGERVVVAPPANLREGQPLEVRP